MGTAPGRKPIIERNLWRAGLATIVLAGIAALAQNAPAQAVVEFQKQKLYRAVVEALGLESGAEVLDTDMLRLMTLNLANLRTDSLIGLEFATNLEQLDLSENEVPDLTPLIGLTSLQSLDASGNPISDITPLSDMAALQ